MHEFFTVKYAPAQAEDDNVAVFSSIDSAGPYTKMTATVALEGPSWMRRDFVSTVHLRTPQLDADSAAHIAAMQAMLAPAAKLAQDATTNAATCGRSSDSVTHSAWRDSQREEAAYARRLRLGQLVAVVGGLGFRLRGGLALHEERGRQPLVLVAGPSVVQDDPALNGPLPPLLRTSGD
ncbi:hypothetical protein [Streptomyces mirabilis]|uniref:hypothetical protein n=1 Tax=Streptomyces mirabilis TaxID=68239 RepID=UPI0036EA8101